MANEKSRFEINGTSYDLNDAKAVKFDRTQSLTTAQKQKARENIGAGSADDVAGKLDTANVYNGLDKTAAGYALDARQGKVLADKLDATQSGIAIIVNGDTASMAVPVGGYAYIKNNTHGLAEGLYTNSSSAAFPASGGTADGTVFTAVIGGGLNTIQQSMANAAKIGYVSSTNSTTYSFPIESLQIYHDYGCALVSAWRTLFLMFYQLNDVGIVLLKTTAQTAPTCTASINNDIITLTFNTTIWNGITVLPL